MGAFSQASQLAKDAVQLFWFPESLALLADMPTFAVTREIFTAIPVSSLYFISTSLTGDV